MIGFDEFLSKSEFRDQIDIAIDLYRMIKENAQLKAEVEHYKNQLDLTCEDGLTPADAKKLHEANAGLAVENTKLKAEIESIRMIHKKIDEGKQHLIDSLYERCELQANKLEIAKARIAELESDKWISFEDESPEIKKPIMMIAFNVNLGTNKNYTTDPYCGWVFDCQFIRWPHDFSPTHWKYV